MTRLYVYDGSGLDLPMMDFLGDVAVPDASAGVEDAIYRSIITEVNGLISTYPVDESEAEGALYVLVAFRLFGW